jgi:hypothetical protein
VITPRCYPVFPLPSNSYPGDFHQPAYPPPPDCQPVPAQLVHNASAAIGVAGAPVDFPDQRGQVRLSQVVTTPSKEPIVATGANL